MNNEYACLHTHTKQSQRDEERNRRRYYVNGNLEFSTSKAGSHQVTSCKSLTKKGCIHVLHYKYMPTVPFIYMHALL